MEEYCFVCDKHLENSDDLFIEFEEYDKFKVGHAPDREGTSEVYLGALIIEPLRHVENWAELYEEESIQLGALIKDVHRLLFKDESIEHIYTWVFGDSVDHMHIWIAPRYSGTPREYWGVKLDEWPDAPKGGTSEIREKVCHLRALSQ